MKLISVNVGLPREIIWEGRRVATGIFKRPVPGPVPLHGFNLTGDRQADLSAHGGRYKAVYGYPSEHYDYWRAELAQDGLDRGMFGENLTTQGLHESAVHIGDRYRIGTAELVVTQPRKPCFKLGIRFANMEMVQRFLNSRRTGFYFSVGEEGELEAGDSIELVAREPNSITVADANRLYNFDGQDRAMLERAIQIKGLSENWRRHFLEQLRRISS
jgi:MOSC domain-containing protein YiiM